MPKTPSNRRLAKNTAIDCGSPNPLKTSTISSMICGTEIHDQLSDDFFHDLWFTTTGMSTLSENCNYGTPQFSARLDHLRACTTGTSATLWKNCTTTGVSTTLSKNWTNPSDDLHNRVIDHQEQQLRDNNGHVSSLLQELHGPHSERPQENHGLVNNLVQELHDATRRRPTPVPSGNPLWGSWAPALD